jgi:hypothetical protein
MMSSRWIAVAIGAALLASQEAKAACVIHGARPTVPLPTMLSGQEFSFIASPDCETLRFTIRGTDLSQNPMSVGPVGPGPHTYKVALTESEWDAVVAGSHSTLTWVVTGRTSAGVTSRLVTTNDLKGSAVQFDLSTADAKLVGENRRDRAGTSASVAGDVNGDGNDDLFLDSPLNSEGGTRAGAAYLVLGPVTGTLDLSLAHAKLVGEEPGDTVGGSTGAGDIDGDGNDDLLLGSWAHGATGAAYLVHGPVSGTLDLSLADAKLVGEDLGGDYDDYGAGNSVSGAGDADADGHDDVLVGSDGIGTDWSAYLVLGPVTGTLDLGSADAELVTSPSFIYASVVSGAGDVDGDGLDDLLVGAPYEDQGAAQHAGAAYLVRAPVSGVVDLPLEHTELVGEVPGETVGWSVAGAGDIDGDGNDDVLINSYYNSGRGGGTAYVVLGPGPAPGDPWRLESVADAKLRADHSVSTVAGAGDVDLDGHDDILVGARGSSAHPTGAAYLVLSPVAGTRNLSRADIQFTGEHSVDRAGYDVGAGDVDGDGRPDLLISAPFNDEADDNAGAAYLIYGGGL